MENFKMYWNKVPKENRGSPEEVNALIEKARSKKVEKISGEYEKSEEEIKAIGAANALIQKEIKELGIEPKSVLTDDRVHFVSQEIADSLRAKHTGSYRLKGETVLINKDRLKNNKLKTCAVILHEALHYYSFGAVMAMGGDDEHKIEEYRSGYVVKNPIEKNRKHEHFRGLNEAVVEKVTTDIFQKNKDFLIKELDLGGTRLEKEGTHGVGYKEETKVLDLIIDKMAEFYKKDRAEVWQNFKKGLFTGEMMHLRDIEKVFGPESLRILSFMNPPKPEEKIEVEKVQEKFKKFFEEEDEEKRNNIAKEILSERKRLQYEKMIKNNREEK